MTLRLFDGATPWTDDNNPTDRTRLNAVKAHGGIAVSVYIVGRPGGMRCAIKRDVDAARALGLGILPNWERAADALCTGGKANGQTVGKEALAACRALGFPDDGSVAIAFSWDAQIAAGKLDDCGHVADGITAALGDAYLFTAYGPQNLLDYLQSSGRLQGGAWLSGSTFGQPYNPGASAVALLQSHDASGAWLNSPIVGTDVNTITQPDRLAAWWPDGSPYGDGMAFTIDDLLNTEIDGHDGNGNPVKWTIRTWLPYTSAQATRENTALKAQVDALTADLDAVKAQLAQQATQSAAVAVTPTDIPAVLHIGAAK